MGGMAAEASWSTDEPRGEASGSVKVNWPPDRLELRGRLLDLCLALASSDVQRPAQEIYRTALNTAACVYGFSAAELEAILHPAATADQRGGL